jgi:hypothetical protein
LAPQDAGVGSATLNTAQQVGGSIGTALLNTLVASAATSYLSSHALSPTTISTAPVHGDTTAFLWSGFTYIAGAILAGLVLPRGGLSELELERPALPADARSAKSAPTHVVRVRVACR